MYFKSLENILMSASMTATLKYATTSYKKMWVIAKMIRWKDVTTASTLLEFLPKKWAKVMRKVVLSAVANATNNLDKDADKLYIDRVEVGRGPKLKRMRFVGRARIHGYVKHRSFVKVVLASK